MKEMLKSRYLIREQIGRGAFGVIYHATDGENNREIAIKVWKAGSETEIFSHKNSPFMREEKIPGIVKIYDYFEKAGMNFLVMEYLPGGTLKQKMDRIRQENPPEKILELFEPVLEGLAFLHSEGLVHCDLSPDNLMFDEAGSLKLIDLGACRGNGIICDKKFLKEAYSAPEQYTDTERIGPWTDVYGICAVLFEILTGEKPPSSAKRLRRDGLRSISFYTKVDRHIEQVILHGLNLEIQQRYFSMELLLHGLGYDTEKIKVLSGSTRHFWGQKWIQISGLGIGYHENEKKKNRRILKRVGAGIMGILLLIGGIRGADLWMQEHYPVQYFERKARKAKENGIARDDEKQTSKRKMYLDKDSIQKVLFSEMGLNKKKAQTKTEKSYSGSASTGEEDSREFPENDSVVQKSYQVEIPQKGTEEYKISYDPADQRVFCLSGQMTDPERLRTFLETMFPVCCPEAYLTSDEITDLQEQMEKSEEGDTIHVNFHSWLHFSSEIDTEKKTVQYCVEIAASYMGLIS